MQVVKPTPQADGTTLVNVGGTWSIKDGGVTGEKIANDFKPRKFVAGQTTGSFCSSTRVAYPNGLSTTAMAISSGGLRINGTCTLKNFRCALLGGALGVGVTVTVTIRKNGGATAVQVVFSNADGATPVKSDADTVALVDGDVLDLHTANAGGVPTQDLSWSFDLEAA